MNETMRRVGWRSFRTDEGLDFLRRFLARDVEPRRLLERNLSRYRVVDISTLLDRREEEGRTKDTGMACSPNGFSRVA